MKTLRMIGMALFAVLMCVNFASCSNDQNTPTTEEQEFYTVQIGMGGELDIIYEPLSRTTTEDLFGIQVYSIPDKDEETVNWTPYAYGLFDDADDITINLLKGYKYKFVATMIKDGMKKFDFNYGCNGFTGVGDPFGGTNGPTAFEAKFNYTSSWNLGGLGNGLSYLVDGKFYEHPNTDRYYGELDNYELNDNNSKAMIKMKRVSFGAKFIAKGKAAENGTLEILITGAPKMELTPSADKKHISDTFTFSNVIEAWAANGNYTESIAVTINWHRTDGSTIPLGTHDITYKRNATTVVNVKVVNDASAEGVGFDIDETELGIMPDDEDETTIEDGKIVETEVETN